MLDEEVEEVVRRAKELGERVEKLERENAAKGEEQTRKSEVREEEEKGQDEKEAAE
jgi:hypothetical protein